MKLRQIYESIYADISDSELSELLRKNFDNSGDFNFFVIRGSKIIVGHRIVTQEGFYDVYVPTSKRGDVLGTTRYTMRRDGDYKAHSGETEFNINDIKNMPVVKI